MWKMWEGGEVKKMWERGAEMVVRLVGKVGG